MPEALSIQGPTRRAGRVMGVFYLCGAVLAAALYPLPGVADWDAAAIWSLVAATAVLGLACFAIPWERAPYLLHLGVLVALALIAAGVQASGGVESPITPLYLLAAGYSAYFFTVRATLALLALTLLLLSVPLWSDARSDQGAYLASYLSLGASLGIVIVTFLLIRAQLAASGQSARDRAAEAAALRTVATALASSTDISGTSQVLFAQARELLGTDRAVLYRLDGEKRELEVVGVTDMPGFEHARLPLDPAHNATAAAALERRTLAVERAAGNALVNQELVRRYTVASALFLPLHSGEEVVGVLALTWNAPRSFSPAEVGVAEGLAAEAGLALARSQMIESLDRLARTDELTQVANRRAVERRLAEETARSERYGSLLSVLILDLDYLKKVNDTLGHATGDLLLQRLGRTLSQRARQTDLVGRWGGDEFVVVCPSTGTAEALVLAQDIRALCEENDLTVSIGVATREAGEPPDRLLLRADMSLYREKDARAPRAARETDLG